MNWSDIGFRIEITGDGSPSLRLMQSLQEQYADGEAMHHSGGACAETDLIYGTCIRDVFSRIASPHFLVVGLGLGYIEMFIAREALLLQKTPASILSFESVPQLREYFYAWLNDLSLSPEVQQTYDHVVRCVLAGTALKKEQIQDCLKQYFKGLGDIQEALDESTQFKHKYHAILYDAFSGKTTPQLWEEEFLSNFFKKAAANECFLATYACRASLKKSLAAQGFAMDLREGFQGKRNRISASRIHS
jgi:hypothetical protein